MSFFDYVIGFHVSFFISTVQGLPKGDRDSCFAVILWLAQSTLRCMGTPQGFSPILTKGCNFCNFLCIFLEKNIPLKLVLLFPVIGEPSGDTVKHLISAVSNFRGSMKITYYM